MTLQEINDALQANDAECTKLNELKWTHRDYIAEKLGPCHLAAGVTRVEPVKGWTDSRKNACRYSGFRFTINGVQYEAAHGSNWCSSFTSIENIGTGRNEDLPCWEDYVTEEGDLMPRLFSEFKPHVSIGLTLLFRNGVVG